MNDPAPDGAFDVEFSSFYGVHSSACDLFGKFRLQGMGRGGGIVREAEPGNLVFRPFRLKALEDAEQRRIDHQSLGWLLLPALLPLLALKP